MTSGSDDGTAPIAPIALQLAAVRRKTALRRRMEREIQFAVVRFVEARRARVLRLRLGNDFVHVRARPRIRIGQRMHAGAHGFRIAFVRVAARSPNGKHRLLPASTRATACRDRTRSRVENVRARRSPNRRSATPVCPPPPRERIRRFHVLRTHAVAAFQHDAQQIASAGRFTGQRDLDAVEQRRRRFPKRARLKRLRRARRCTGRAEARDRRHSSPTRTR